MTSMEFCLQGPTGWITKHSKFSMHLSIFQLEGRGWQPVGV